MRSCAPWQRGWTGGRAETLLILILIVHFILRLILLTVATATVSIRTATILRLTLAFLSCPIESPYNTITLCFINQAT